MPDVDSRARLARTLQEVLRVDAVHAERIVKAFDDFVAQPLESNLTKLTGRDLAKRNPMIYTARGTTTVDDWVGRVLADKETSAIEAHLGTWLEEVARIVSGGFKPEVAWISSATTPTIRPLSSCTRFKARRTRRMRVVDDPTSTHSEPQRRCSVRARGTWS